MASIVELRQELERFAVQRDLDTSEHFAKVVHSEMLTLGDRLEKAFQRECDKLSDVLEKQDLLDISFQRECGNISRTLEQFAEPVNARRSSPSVPWRSSIVAAASTVEHTQSRILSREFKEFTDESETPRARMRENTNEEELYALLPAQGFTSEASAEDDPRGKSMTYMNTTASRITFTDYNDDDEFESPQTLQDVVKHPYFEYSTCVLVFLSSLFMGFEANYSLSHIGEEMPFIFVFIDTMVCIIFAVELSLRLWVFGMELFAMSGWQWNIFDCIVVFLQVVGTCLQILNLSSEKSENLTSILKIGRLSRILRVIRIARVFTFVAELRMLCVTLFSTMRCLSWVIGVIMGTTYVFGLFIVIIVDNARRENPDTEWDPLIEELYGSLGGAMYTSFLVVSGGLEWYHAARPIEQDITALAPPLFSLYVCFMMFCLFNVMQGVFLGSALKTADDDKKRSTLDKMVQLFKKGDADASGEMDWIEFELHLRSRDMQLYLQTLDWNVDDAQTLFNFIDQDSSGTITVEEFSSGCQRLSGPVKAVDFALFKSELRLLLEESLADLKPGESNRRCSARLSQF